MVHSFPYFLSHQFWHLIFFSSNSLIPSSLLHKLDTVRAVSLKISDLNLGCIYSHFPFFCSAFYPFSTSSVFSLIFLAKGFSWIHIFKEPVLSLLFSIILFLLYVAIWFIFIASFPLFICSTALFPMSWCLANLFWYFWYFLISAFKVMSFPQSFSVVVPDKFWY